MTVSETGSTLITTYLHMTDRSDFRPVPESESGLTFMQMRRADVPFYRFLYNTVGEDWRWRDRRLMIDEQLAAILSSPDVSVYVLYADGVPAGYVELAKDGTTTEVAYLGLRPEFTGRGLGKYLLSYGISRAWDDGAQRVWVHTCNLDAPSALSNYLKRGFQIYEVREEPMPERYT